jgi:hypothetical protein
MMHYKHGPRTVVFSRGPFFILCALLLLAPASRAAEDPMTAIQRILDMDTPGLAMAMIKRKQQEIPAQSANWWQLEMQRLAMLQQDGKWDQINARTSQYNDLPEQHLGKLVELHARSLMKQGHPNDARIYLQQFLFAGRGSKEAQGRWQRLLVETHIQERRYQEARDSLIKYSQGIVQDHEWLLLHARLLLLLGQQADALALLVEPRDEMARVYALLATLQNTGKEDSKTLDNIIRDARKQGKNKKLSMADRARYWYIVGGAAASKQDLARAIAAYEIYLAYALESSLDDALFSYAPDNLWQLYEQQASQIADSKKLQPGDWPEWQALAKKLANKAPASARALYAYMARHAGEGKKAVASHTQLWKLLARNDYGLDTLYQLYMRSLSYSMDYQVPVIIRHVLVNRALKQQDYRQASDWLKDLDTPPENMDELRWRLQRARIHVYADNLDMASTLLVPVIDDVNALESKQVDQLMQVIFDIQANGRHAGAIELFQQLLKVATKAELVRETYYWMADSYRAEQQFIDASYYFLLSARQGTENDMDMWGQSAYYQAAAALARAGLHHDAMVIYEKLLKVTTEPGRQEILQKHIRRLRMQNKQDETS